MFIFEKIIQEEKAMLVFAMMTGISALVFLTVSVRNGQLEYLDQTILGWFHTLQNPMLDRCVTMLTWLGSLWLLLPASMALIAVLLFYGHRFEAVLFAAGFGGAIITTYVMKFSLDRARPVFFPAIDSLPPDPAFPSGHTTQAFSFVLTLWLVSYNLDLQWKNYAVSVLLVAAFVVALSRLYLQVHFPSDVFAGVLVALLWAGVTLYYIKSGGIT